jgi:lipopolysaccharide export system protein LptA
LISAILLAAALAAPRVSPEARAVPVQVEADSIVYDYKARRTVMTGSPLVTLTRDDATLVCKRITARMDEAGRIADAVCEGDVKLTRGERVVTCALARFESAAGRVRCEGTPVLRDGPSVVEGELLVYDLDDDRVTLTRAKGKVLQQPGQKLPPLATPRAER